MNNYQRIFGSGPRGTVLSVALLGLAYILETRLALPAVLPAVWLSRTAFTVLALLAVALIIWSTRSLPPSERGKGLCTAGAFRWFRHPLYAAMLTFFNFGLAALLNNWIYVVWAALQHPIWHWNVAAEEQLMRKEFPGEYDDYAARTGRFVPRLVRR